MLDICVLTGCVLYHNKRFIKNFKQKKLTTYFKWESQSYGDKCLSLLIT